MLLVICGLFGAGRQNTTHVAAAGDGDALAEGGCRVVCHSSVTAAPPSLTHVTERAADFACAPGAQANIRSGPERLMAGAISSVG